MYVEDNDVSCVVDGANGIYSAQRFVERFGENLVFDEARGWGMLDADSVRMGPEHEHYDEAWCDLMDNAVVVLGSTRYTIHQDGDIFLVRDGVEWCDDCDTWLTTDTGCEHAQ